jgi:hypothetical protein
LLAAKIYNSLTFDRRKEMSITPTTADAELIMKLYDLRREAELRKARNWWIGFWPESADDILKIATALGTQENAWMRQVGGYWEMAASFVLHGTLNRELFLEPSFSGEMFVVFGKVEPFLKELREKMQNPAIFANVEKLIATSEGAPERLKQTQQRMAMMRKAAQAKAAA